MNMKKRTRKAQACLLTVALISMIATLAAEAAPPPLNPRVTPRPVTDNDVAIYHLPASTEYSGGLSTIGIGTAVYLEADVNIAVPPASITNVTWSLKAPPGSVAVFSNSPLPATMPVFLPSDRLLYQVAERMLLRPDVIGQYTVTANIATTNGTTNASLNLTAGTYTGVFTCELCHSGGQVAPDIYPYWANTAHAGIFTGGIDGLDGSHYSVSCIKCHTVGYDTNANTLGDGGFYAVAQQDGWTFPTVLAPTNFASMPANLQNLANVQCENCHGPGSAHAGALGDTNAANWPLIDVPYVVGTCEQCHDAPPQHADGTQWYVSSHAVTTTIPTGPGRDQCVQCHTSLGFITRTDNLESTNTSFPPTNTTYYAIGCQTCHEPHGITIPTNDNYLLRIVSSATFGDGTVVTNAGAGILCMNCHHSRNGSAVTNVAYWPLGIPVWSGASEPPSSHDFGPHDNPQGDMFEGINAITYGQSIPSSAHKLAVTNACVGCHMQTIASTDPGFLLSGGHTWEMSYLSVTNGVTNKVEQVAVCNQCHGGINSFDFPVFNYNGVTVGIQTEVQSLLNQLSTLLPNSKGVVAGTVQTSLSVTTNWTTAQLNAAYNWMFVNNDGSLGVHNAPFATGLLQASIANLTGVSVPGGLPDAWEITYFGSVTNASGAPDASPAGDGIPNWLKYSLGLNPLVAGLAVPNGVVYANGNTLGGNTPTNALEIYTAADVTFDVAAGTTYQIQEVSALSGGWQNVGDPIVATNSSSVSYLTPTVGNVQQYFRVVQTQ
jgi:hypothetical protein